MDRASRMHAESLLVDIHAHPALKVLLFNADLAKRHSSPRFWWPFTLRTDLPKLREGNVDVVLSAIYIPEKDILDDCRYLKLLLWLCPNYRRIVHSDPFELTMSVLAEIERRVDSARIDGRAVAQVAHSYSEMEHILSDGKIAFVHSIESGHSLVGKKENVRKCFDAGVCMITIAHFYENELVGTVDGVPQSYKQLGCFRQHHDLTKGLTAAGREVVEEMLDLGVIVDLTQATPKARAEIYAVNHHERPLVISHVGVQRYFDDPMNPTDNEIEQIAKTGGIIGLIFFNYWLCGDAKRKNGLDLIVDSIKHIKAVGGIETVAIGTDFDGLTDPPDDLKDPSQMPRLTERLLSEGFSTDDVRKILGENAKRVLRMGWGRT